jgi:hypothetical protein
MFYPAICSWLQTSRHAPAYIRNKRNTADGQAARFGMLTRVTNEEFKVRHSYLNRDTRAWRPSQEVSLQDAFYLAPLLQRELNHVQASYL